jgi:SAM-dependent methyltransferase
MTTEQAWQVTNDAAEVYERDFVPALFGPWAPRLADVARLALGERVLDVGCGTGVLAREAARRVGRTGHVVGLDLNAGMLAVGARVAPTIDWRRGDAVQLPFEVGAFDVVLSQFMLMFVADRVAALREMWRVLAPCGRLALAVWAPIDRVPSFATLAGILRRRLGDAAAGVLEAPFALGNVDELRALLLAAQIPDARIETQRGRARYASLDDFVRIEIRGTPLSGLVGDQDYAQLLDDTRRALGGARSRDATFAFDMHAHVVTACKP